MDKTDTTTRWKGFRPETLAQFGVELYDDRVEIPYLTLSGRHYRTKVFTPERSWWDGPSKPQVPYGLETLLRDTPTLYVTEGESDALALRCAFPDAAVLGLPGASSWKSGWAPRMNDFGLIYLSFDGDPAGLGLLDVVKRDIPSYRVIDLPRGADTRDVLQRLGRRAYNVLVEAADRGYECRRAYDNLDEVVRRRVAVDQAWERATG